MREAAQEALEIGKDRSPDDLRQDRLRTLALLKAIEIVGEAASRISAEFRAAHSEIPWADIIGMRNRLIHVYFEVDLARVCDTITTDLPPLIAALDGILRSAD